MGGAGLVLKPSSPSPFTHYADISDLGTFPVSEKSLINPIVWSSSPSFEAANNLKFEYEEIDLCHY